MHISWETIKEILSLSEESVQALSTYASLSSVPITLLQWLHAVHLQRKENQNAELCNTISHYLEWLRRGSHQELCSVLTENSEAIEQIGELIGNLAALAYDDNEDLLNRLDALGRAVYSLKEHPNLKLAEFEKRYLEAIERKYRTLKTFGITPNARELRQPLSIAYVSLSLVCNDGDGERFRAAELLESQATVSIIGKAGSGKTTLLSWIAYQCTQKREDNPWYGGIPFFVRLRSLVDRQGTPDLFDFTKGTVEQFPDAPPSGWMFDILHSQRRAVLLFDGIDELPAASRETFWIWLNDHCDQYPGNRIFVSSRSLPARELQHRHPEWLPPPNFVDVEIQDLLLSEQSTLIDQWHKAMQAQLLNAPTATDDTDLKDLDIACQGLKERLSSPENVRVRDLCRNPLLCSMICTLHWIQRGILPDGKVGLYHACTEMLLHKRDRQRGIFTLESSAGELKPEDFRTVMRYLAWDMTTNAVGEGLEQQIEISREEALKFVRSALQYCRSRDAASQAYADDVIEHLIVRVGLLRSPSRGRIDFHHRSFQEYFAACGAVLRDASGTLANNAEDDRWRDTIVMAAGTSLGGQPFGELIVSKLITRGTDSHQSEATKNACIALALACLDTLPETNFDLEDRVVGCVHRVVPPTHVDQAHSFALAGDAILEHIKWEKVNSRDVTVIAACARTLALIGSPDALAMATSVGYGTDNRESVMCEICRFGSTSSLSFPSIVRILQSQREIPRSLQEIFSLNGRLILGEHLETLTSLDLSWWNGNSLAHVCDIPNLKRISIRSKLLSALEMPIPQMIDCVEVVGRCRRSDLSVLASATHLRRLALAGYPEEVQCLLDFEQLTSLTVSRNEKESVKKIGKLSALKELTFKDAVSVDLRPLGIPSSLESLAVDGGKITYLGDLALRLKTLTISRRRISELGCILGLTALQDLTISISEYCPLEQFAKLRELRRLSIDCTDMQLAEVSKILPNCLVTKLETLFVPLGRSRMLFEWNELDTA